MRHLEKAAVSALVITFAIAAPAPVRAGSLIEKTLNLAPGGRLVVEAAAGSVTVKGGAGSVAKIRITAKSGDDLESKFDFRFEETPGEVRVRSERKETSWLSLNYSTGSPRFEIEVPAKTRVEISTGGGGIDLTALEGDARVSTSGGGIEVERHVGSVEAETSGGGIEIRDVRGNVRAETSGGGIEVRKVTGNLTAETSGGSIEVEDVSGDASVETSGGSIEVERAGGKVLADSSAGSVEVGFLPGNAKGGSISSSAGSVVVRVDATVGLRIEADASVGSVSTDLPLGKDARRSRSHLSGVLGAGGELLHVETGAGSIRLTSLAI